MREINRPKFLSYDGKEFDTATECRAYESANLSDIIARMSPDEISGGLCYMNREVGDLLEEAGMLAQAARKAAGHYRKRKNGPAEGPPAPADADPGEDADHAERVQEEA